MPKITDAKILIVATDGFEQSELMKPQADLKEKGATVHVASPQDSEGETPGEIKGWDEKDWGKSVAVDLSVDEANADDYDALVLPGGQMNPDVLRGERAVLDLIDRFDEQGKPIAAICHAPWLLIEAGLAGQDRTMTSYASIKTDVRNAGATWVDQEVVTDGNIITARQPEDLDAFIGAVVKAVEAGKDASSAA